MDLSTLGSTLPPGLADAERDMGNKFRGMCIVHVGYHCYIMDHPERDLKEPS